MKNYQLPQSNTVQCLKGSKYHQLTKNKIYPVTQIKIQDDTTVAITLQLTNRQQTFYVRHPNFLLKPNGFNAHTGNPTKNVRLLFTLTH